MLYTTITAKYRQKAGSRYSIVMVLALAVFIIPPLSLPAMESEREGW
jgi:hypothetical protein